MEITAFGSLATFFPPARSLIEMWQLALPTFPPVMREKETKRQRDSFFLNHSPSTYHHFNAQTSQTALEGILCHISVLEIAQMKPWERNIPN